MRDPIGKLGCLAFAMAWYAGSLLLLDVSPRFVDRPWTILLHLGWPILLAATYCALLKWRDERRDRR